MVKSATRCITPDRLLPKSWSPYCLVAMATRETAPAVMPRRVAIASLSPLPVRSCSVMSAASRPLSRPRNLAAISQFAASPGTAVMTAEPSLADTIRV